MDSQREELTELRGPHTTIKHHDAREEEWTLACALETSRAASHGVREQKDNMEEGEEVHLTFGKTLSLSSLGMDPGFN